MDKKILMIIFATIVLSSFVNAGLPSQICYPLNTGIVCINSSIANQMNYVPLAPQIYFSGSQIGFNTTWSDLTYSSLTSFNSLSNLENANNLTQANLINTKHNFANCPAGEIVQNTTLNGVQCVPNIAGSPYIAGLGLNLTSYTFNINFSYFNGLFYQKSEVDSIASGLQSNITNVNSSKVDKTLTIRSVNSPILINSGSSATLITDINLSIPQANDTAGGFLSATDHAYFGNNKLNVTDQRFNDTLLINAINSSLQIEITLQNINNNTQASLITNEISLQSANNNTQASLINSLFFANNTLRSDNTTQASLISNEINLQNANNNTQAILINDKASLTTNNIFAITSNNTFNGETYFLGNVNLFNNTQNSFNLTFLLKDNLNVVQGNWSINPSNGLADFYTSGKIYQGGISINTLYNATNLINALNTSTNADNTTQANLITNEINLQSFNNATQASLITNLFNANTTLWNKQSADNTTLTNSINNLLTNDSNINAREVADNTTQAALITSLFNANATLRADNTTQAAQIATLVADNTTQATLINNRVQKTGDNMTGMLYINVPSDKRNPLIIAGNNDSFIQSLITNANPFGSSDIWLGNNIGDNATTFGVGMGITGTNFSDKAFLNATPANTSYIIFGNSSFHIVGGTIGKGINFGLDGWGLTKWIMNISISGLNLNAVNITNVAFVGINTTTPNQPLTVNGNINQTNGCIYLPGGGKICGNTTCSTIYSPNGLTITEVCN